MIAPLHRRPTGDRQIPALDVGIVVEVDGLPLEPGDPRPCGDIGHRVVVDQVLVAGEPLVEHAVEALRLGEVAFLGVSAFSLVEPDEMMDLAEHRADTAHLPHQPLHRPPAGLVLGRHQHAGLLGEIEQDRARLHHRHPVVMVDDGGDLVVRAYGDEVRAMLVALGDVDRMRRVRQPDLLQHDRDLAAVRCGPGVEIDHVRVPFCEVDLVEIGPALPPALSSRAGRA